MRLSPRPPASADGSAPASASTSRAVGQLWSIDAGGLDPARLAGEEGVRALSGLFDALIRALDLHPVQPPTWHVFPGPHAGVTGFVPLSESHLACHSFPEHGGLTLDLYTCRRRPAPDWGALVARAVGREGVRPTITVHTLERTLPAARGEAR